MSGSLTEELMQTESGRQLLKAAENGCEKPQMPEADVDTAEIRRILSKFFPQWRVDQILEDRCPYCGSRSPEKFKIYKHPKDGDCIGIYTCTCGKLYVRSEKVHAEVW